MFIRFRRESSKDHSASRDRRATGQAHAPADFDSSGCRVDQVGKLVQERVLADPFKKYPYVFEVTSIFNKSAGQSREDRPRRTVLPTGKNFAEL